MKGGHVTRTGQLTPNQEGTTTTLVCHLEASHLQWCPIPGDQTPVILSQHKCMIEQSVFRETGLSLVNSSAKKCAFSRKWTVVEASDSHSVNVWVMTPTVTNARAPNPLA